MLGPNRFSFYRNRYRRLCGCKIYSSKSYLSAILWVCEIGASDDTLYPSSLWVVSAVSLAFRNAFCLCLAVSFLTSLDVL